MLPMLERIETSANSGGQTIQQLPKSFVLAGQAECLAWLVWFGRWPLVESVTFDTYLDTKTVSSPTFARGDDHGDAMCLTLQESAFPAACSLYTCVYIGR